VTATTKTSGGEHRVVTGQDLRLPQDQWPDRLTPMYDEKVIKKWIAGRPGSGRRAQR